MKKILIAMMIMVAGFNASAGIMVEPYLAYNLVGDFDNVDTSGVNYGARLGYSLPALFSLGLDYNMGTYDHDGTDVDHTKFGAFVAVDLPILARAWASYYFSAKAEAGASEVDGDGFGLGVGLTMLPFVSLNLEYRSLSYDGNVDASEVLVGVSLPLDL